MRQSSVLQSLGGTTAAIVSLCLTTLAPADSVSHYAADGNAQDSAGRHHGTLMNGAGFSAGIAGQAFALNGTTQHVVVPDDPDWHFGSAPFTVAVWANFTTIKRGPLGSVPNAFVAHDNGSGSNNKWIFFYDGQGHLCFHINGPGSAFIVPPTMFVAQAGEWHHYAVTRIGSTYSFYVDGVSLGTGTSSLTVPDASVPMTIGQAEGVGFLHGSLDDLQIYHRALTCKEIQELVQNPGTALSATPCIADLNGDLQVDGADLGFLLGSWGA
jgi:sialidase-1